MSRAGTGRLLVLLAKAPLPGLAKTRLVDGRAVDRALAARLAEAFVRDTLDLCLRAAGERVLVAYAPRESADWFRSAAPGAALCPQVDGDLGARIAAAFDAAFALDAERVVMIGADTPHLRPERIEAAYAALERHACVLGPAADGGYYLVGLRQPRPELFAGLAWSTPRVLAETLERAQASGLSVDLLPEEHDVDEIADLRRLARELAQDPQRCPRTAEILREVP